MVHERSNGPMKWYVCRPLDQRSHTLEAAVEQAFDGPSHFRSTSRSRSSGSVVDSWRASMRVLRLSEANS
jgi:hypothetical protein